MFNRLSWNDVLVSFPTGKDVNVASEYKDGLYYVYINGVCVVEATRGEAMLIMLGLSKMFGMKMSKQILNLKPNKNVTERFSSKE